MVTTVNSCGGGALQFVTLAEDLGHARSTFMGLKKKLNTVRMLGISKREFLLKFNLIFFVFAFHLFEILVNSSQEVLMNYVDVSYQFSPFFLQPTFPLLFSNLFLIRHLTEVANDMNPHHNYSICCGLHQCEN